MDELSWQKVSAALDAAAKIYGFRLDKVHKDIFKFQGVLNRAEIAEDNKILISKMNKKTIQNDNVKRKLYRIWKKQLRKTHGNSM